MRINLISLVRAGADALEAVGDEYGRAYALHEAGNNLIELLTGKCSLAEFQECYVAGLAGPLDLDQRFPPIDQAAEDNDA